MVAHWLAVSPQTGCLTNDEVYDLADSALRSDSTMFIVLDMTRVREATTATFAHLVMLRRALRLRGKDLRLFGLQDRAADLYEISRLHAVLPCL